ncbi:MAG: hypothetical protein FWF85_04470 [Clostridiales bacterium]|nr:hypothetical protein [Clostridiales bacterium]
MSDAETFTRLYYYGTVQMSMAPEDFWLTPIGFFLDLWACHKQFLGVEKAHGDMCIDDILPSGI